MDLLPVWNAGTLLCVPLAVQPASSTVRLNVLKAGYGFGTVVSMDHAACMGSAHWAHAPRPAQSE